MTNFEKIKNMSVDELASECCKRLTCAFCPIEDFCEPIVGGDARYVNCIKVWKKWLKSEAENNNENLG